MVSVVHSIFLKKFQEIFKMEVYFSFLDVILSATKFVSERLCPIFQVSNVSGENLDLLKNFMNLLSSRQPNTDEEPSEFQIGNIFNKEEFAKSNILLKSTFIIHADDTYSVPGVGTVVSGTNLRGTIKVNDQLLLGPDPLGTFTPIAVKSIHRYCNSRFRNLKCLKSCFTDY